MGVTRQLRDLPNLGPASEHALRSVGIDTPEQLDAIGAVEAYRRVRVAGIWPQTSRNLLWALAGALLDVDWRELSPALRASLLHELEAADAIELVNPRRPKRAHGGAGSRSKGKGSTGNGSSRLG